MIKASHTKRRIQSTFPSFIIGGAAKSGTTSLSRYLDQIPVVFIPGRELNFFTYAESKPRYQVMNHNFIDDLGFYQHLLTPPESTSSRKLIGEKSVSYLYKDYCEQVIHNIKAYHPEWMSIRWIFILRHPAHRAYSQYVHNLNFHEEMPFMKAIELWPKRKSDGWIPAYDYLGAGFYSESIRTFQQQFDHVRCYLFEDLQLRPTWLMQDLLSYLGINNKDHEIQFLKHNTSGIPKNAVYKKGLSFIKGYKPKSGENPPTKSVKNGRLKQQIRQYLYYKPAVPERHLNEISQLYADEIHDLEKVIQRDLTSWYFKKNEDEK